MYCRLYFKMKPSQATVANIVDQVGKGNLADVINEIEALDMSTDMLVKVADSFSRRLKKLDGELLQKTEKTAAGKLLLHLLSSKVCPKKDVFPYIFVVSSIYRHLVIKEKLALIEMGDRLLELHDSWDLPESNDLTILRNNFYAYTWNFLRENYSNLIATDNLRIIAQSLRWMVRQGEKSFSSISHKMHQMSHIVTACENFAPVEHFIKQILYDAREIWLEDLLPQSWEQSVVQFDGVFNFIVCSIRYALVFKKLDRAKQIRNEILESFAMYFDADAGALLEKACHYFYIFASYLSNPEEFHSSEQDVMVIASQISKLVENSKIPGARLMLSYGFLQGICSLLQSFLREPRMESFNGRSREVDRLISALFKLNYIMQTASSHPDLPHLDQKRRDLETNMYFAILRLIIECINTQKEVTFTMKMVAEKSFDGIRRLLLDTKTKDVLLDFFNKIIYHGGQLGTALVRIKDFDAAVKLMTVAVDLLESFQTEELLQNTKSNSSQLAFLIADAHNQAKNFSAGLQFLAETLYKNQHLMEPQRKPSCVDVLEPISWYDWSYHWISLKRSAASSDSRSVMCKTTADYLLNSKQFSSSISNNEKLLLKMLHFEFNAYFTTKSAIPDGLIAVGEALESLGSAPMDHIMGLMSQGIGFWWGDTIQIEDAISLFKQAILKAEKETEKSPDSSTVWMAVALCHIWFALGNLRKFQEAAVEKLEGIKNVEAMRNPKKFSGTDDERALGRVVPAVSSLCLEDEFLVASHLIKGVSILSNMISVNNEKDLRQIADSVGPALVTITLKLSLSILGALGSKDAVLKCSLVTKTFSVLYNRANLTVSALSEIMKAAPSMEPYLSETLQELKDELMSRQNSSLLRSQGICLIYFMKVTLARAYAHFHLKKYQDALSALSEVFGYRLSTDVFDVGHQVLGEAYFLLADLKLLEADLNLDLGTIPKYLRYITPVGLASKGYKILSSVARNPQPTESGWNDQCHNYELLKTVMEVSEKTVMYYSLCGKLKEARCVAADFIYFAQQMAMVSRTINLTIPLAEMDAKSRNFDSCQQKIECLLSMLRGCIPGTTETLDSKRLLETGKKLQISKEFLKVLVEENKETWEIAPVSIPEHTFGQYGPPPAGINDSPTVPGPRMMKRIMYLHHPLNCDCYICSHPKIIPSVIKFYCLQARLSSCAKKMHDSGRILETANRYHLKAVLRLLNNFDGAKESLKHFLPLNVTSESLRIIYRDFIVQPGITSQMTKMEMMPAMDLKEAIPCYNQVMEALKQVHLDVSVYSSMPLEILCAAIFKATFSESNESIRIGNIRETLDQVVEEEVYPDAHSPEPSKQIPSAYVNLVPKRGAAKGVFSHSIQDDDDDLPEKETLDISAVKRKAPPRFQLVDIDDEEEDDCMEKTDDEEGDDSIMILKQTGPSLNTRSRAQGNNSS